MTMHHQPSSTPNFWVPGQEYAQRRLMNTLQSGQDLVQKATGLGSAGPSMEVLELGGGRNEARAPKHITNHPRDIGRKGHGDEL